MPTTPELGQGRRALGTAWATKGSEDSLGYKAVRTAWAAR